MKRSLLVCAHPDDEVLGCGGMVAKYSDRVEYHVLVIAEGSSCRFDSAMDENVIEAVELRESALKDAMNLLGVNNVCIHRLHCGRLDTYPIIELNKLIEAQIRKVNPVEVFTHSQQDVNNDHRIVARAVEMACRPAAFPNIEALYSFEILSSSECSFETPFTPNVFVRLDEAHVELKWRALGCYDTEVSSFPYPRSRESIFSLANYRGVQSASAYAEAYRLIRRFQ